MLIFYLDIPFFGHYFHDSCTAKCCAALRRVERLLRRATILITVRLAELLLEGS